MQRLTRIVREEGIVADLLPESRTTYQIGMKQHPVGTWMHAGAHPARSNLPGSKAHNRTLLIVVGLAAVDDIAALGILEEQSIDSIVDRKTLGPSRGLRQVNHTHQRSGLRQVNHTHQRMFGLKSEQLVIGIHAVEFDYVVHSYNILVVQFGHKIFQQTLRSLQMYPFYR